MSKYFRKLAPVLIALLATVFILIPAQAQDSNDQPVVRAILFYSPSCGHCENLIQNELPPLLAQYGDQLKIVAIDISRPEGQELYQSAIVFYEIPDGRLGVPTMIVEDIVMVGGGEIPAQFPGLVAEELANGGTTWPEFPGLAGVVATVKFSSQPTGNAQIDDPYDGKSPIITKYMQDPVANTIAVIVLFGLIATVIAVIISFTKPVPEKEFWPKWVIPVLTFLGMGVAFYLTYIESSGVEAVCGPVGDCNAVQLSPYAVLFGVLPVGLLGLIGYALILIGWAFTHFGPKNLRWAAAIAVWGMAFFGVLFSIYLTFLEPFVIGATCMWCISSAIFQAIIFMAATGPAKQAWQEDDFDDEDFEYDDIEYEEEGHASAESDDLLATKTDSPEDEADFTLIEATESAELNENGSEDSEASDKPEEDISKE